MFRLRKSRGQRAPCEGSRRRPGMPIAAVTRPSFQSCPWGDGRRFRPGMGQSAGVIAAAAQEKPLRRNPHVILQNFGVAQEEYGCEVDIESARSEDEPIARRKSSSSATRCLIMGRTMPNLPSVHRLGKDNNDGVILVRVSPARRAKQPQRRSVGPASRIGRGHELPREPRPSCFWMKGGQREELCSGRADGRYQSPLTRDSTPYAAHNLLSALLANKIYLQPARSRCRRHIVAPHIGNERPSMRRSQIAGRPGQRLPALRRLRHNVAAM